MIPAFLQMERAPVKVSDLRPPPRHKAVVRPRAVRLLPWTAPYERLSPAKKAGLRYEAHFHDFARRLWGPSYRTFENEIFAFTDVDGPRACRPDGILHFPNLNVAVIFEAKIRHISDSYFQLKELYEPVVRAAPYYRDLRTVCIEVVRHHDPVEAYPCKTQLLGLLDITDYASSEQPTNEVGVWVWKDK